MEKLTFQEEEVMLIVWRKGEGVIKDFLNEMDEPRPPLHHGGIHCEKLGTQGICFLPPLREHLCLHPCGGRERLQKPLPFRGGAQLFRELLQGDGHLLCARKQKISAEELKEIVRLIEKP